MQINFQNTSLYNQNEKSGGYDFYSKILLIEDNIGDARLVELLLEESDMDCEIVNKTNLAEGMAALAEDSYEEDEIVYITDRLIKFNVAKYIYEYVSLCLPIVKVYDCENDDPMPCNETILDILEHEVKEEPAENQANPIWDELKKLNKN